MTSWRLSEGDALAEMATLHSGSVDAVVTDPPYDLTSARPGGRSPATEGAVMRGFMGLAWDGSGVAFQPETWREALRVLKPGGHLLAFGGTRTYHRLACAIEDAGFEIRDCIAWLYGSGFPKSLDVSKAIDKAAGAERKVVGISHAGASNQGGYKDDSGGPMTQASDGIEPLPLTAPATPEAERWQGWGTALKPAHEPIVVARKPLSGTVAQTVLEHGCGALNVDGCRIEHDGRGVWGNHGQHPENHLAEPGSEGTTMGEGWHSPGSTRHEAGRWPANVALDPEAARMLDEQSGERPTSKPGTTASVPKFDGDVCHESSTPQIEWGYGDTGGASRFFYTAKASRAERNAGLEGFEEKDAHTLSGGEFVAEGRTAVKGKARARNVHPTVKPVALMCWLVRLVTPPGGTVLDPFAGSGTTGIAALREGFGFIGIEREAEYVAIARARILADQPLFNASTESAA